MNLVADESVHSIIVDQLRADGHSVRAISETNRGAVDPDVLAVAISEKAVLLTQDKDFGELVVRAGMNHCGIVLIRLAEMAAQARAQLVSGLFRDHGTELPNSFTVISAGGVRIRPPGTHP